DARVRIIGDLCVVPNENLSCPDYVFADDYDLMSLQELESFITANKHLPGVKSAGEVKEQGGVNFVEISYSLLEKVEELTLYTIAQQKTMEEMQGHIQRLQDQLTNIED
ncbi:MAG: hypothetical protein AAF206_21135, partial [Bacteroidota bacterium]